MQDQSSDGVDLTDLDYTIPLYTKINGGEVHVAVLRGTYRDGRTSIGDAELADAFGKAWSYHSEKAERARRRTEQHQRLCDALAPEGTTEQLLRATAQASAAEAQAPAIATVDAEPVRMGVLWLPEHDGRIPFALVVSNAGHLMGTPEAETLETFSRQLGAEHVLITPYPADV